VSQPWRLQLKSSYIKWPLNSIKLKMKMGR